MSIDSSTPAAFNGHEYAKETARILGNNLENKNKLYQDALRSGDSAKMAEAMLDRDKANEEYQGFLAVLAEEHDTIMRAISQIST